MTRTFLAIDPGSPGGDFTGFCAMVDGKIAAAFAIPAEHLQPEPFEYSIQRAQLAANLYAHHVGERIIERVLRLNHIWQEGMTPRGVRRHRMDDPRIWRNAMPKGEFLRDYGRANFEALPNFLLVKRGRRRWVPWEVIKDRTWEIWQGRRRVDFVTVADGPGFWDHNTRLRVVRWREFAKMMGFPAES